MKRRRPPYSEMVAQMLLDLAEGEEHVIAAVTAHKKQLEAQGFSGPALDAMVVRYHDFLHRALSGGGA